METPFQVVQSLDLIKTVVPSLEDFSWVYGALMCLLVGLVIVGGIKSISRVAAIVVPFMCGIYLFACLFIIVTHLSQIPSALILIFEQAFSPDAAFGGFLGVLIIGIKRAVFSNEAGIGSAAIALCSKNCRSVERCRGSFGTIYRHNYCL